MEESSFNDFLSEGLFHLNEEELIIDLNAQIFDMLGMQKHPDKYNNYFWTPETPMIDSNHFNVMFSGGFSWMMIRANPKTYDSGGWAYQTEITHSFRQNDIYTLKITYGQVLQLLKNANCDIERRVEKIIKRIESKEFLVTRKCSTCR